MDTNSFVVYLKKEDIYVDFRFWNKIWYFNLRNRIHHCIKKKRKSNWINWQKSFNDRNKPRVSNKRLFIKNPYLLLATRSMYKLYTLSTRFFNNFFVRRQCYHIFVRYIYHDTLIRSSKFHNELKEADIVPVHKKKSKFSKENHRPISILPNISRVSERCLYDQISNFFEDVFWKFPGAFNRQFLYYIILRKVSSYKKVVIENGLIMCIVIHETRHQK